MDRDGDSLRSVLVVVVVLADIPNVAEVAFQLVDLAVGSDRVWLV